METTGCSSRVHSGLVWWGAGVGEGSVGTGEFWDRIVGNGRVMKQRIRPGTAREATSRGNTVMVAEADLSSPLAAKVGLWNTPVKRTDGATW